MAYKTKEVDLIADQINKLTVADRYLKTKDLSNPAILKIIREKVEISLMEACELRDIFEKKGLN